MKMLLVVLIRRPRRRKPRIAIVLKAVEKKSRRKCKSGVVPARTRKPAQCIRRKVHSCVSSFTIDFPVPVTRTLWLSAVLLICEIAFKIFAYAVPCSEYYISRTKLIALHPTNRKGRNTSPAHRQLRLGVEGVTFVLLR